MVLRTVIHLWAKRQAAPTATAIAADLAKARRLHEVCYQQAEPRHQQEEQRIKTEFEETNRRLDQDWKQGVKEAIDLRDLRPRQIDEKARRVAGKNEQLCHARLERMERAGFVSRQKHEKDRRARRVRLKALGRRRYEAARVAAVRMQEEVLSVLPPHRRETFLEDLQTVGQACRVAADQSARL